MKITNQKILITGGASGIGLGLTEKFLSDNNTVIICGRRAEVLQDVSDRFPSVITKTCDLSSENDRIALYDWIAENHSDLDILVNNAGIQNWMQVSDADFYEKASNEIAVNVLAPIHLIHLFAQLPALKTIMNVTSGLAFVQFSKVPVYCATKAFFHSFTLSLRYLMKGRAIEVIEIIPPALNTDLGGKGLHDGQPEVKDFVDSIFEQMEAGKTELTYGHSEIMANGSPEAIRERFKLLNP